MLKQSSTLNEIEIQAVEIVSEPPWHLWQAGILRLIHARGERMLACYDEPVVVVSKFWKMTRSQPKVKVEIPSQHCQMEQMLQMRSSALQLLMD